MFLASLHIYLQLAEYTVIDIHLYSRMMCVQASSLYKCIYIYAKHMPTSAVVVSCAVLRQYECVSYRAKAASVRTKLHRSNILFETYNGNDNDDTPDIRAVCNCMRELNT